MLGTVHIFAMFLVSDEGCLCIVPGATPVFMHCCCVATCIVLCCSTLKVHLTAV